jgi:16S rRNA processing protein RimM
VTDRLILVGRVAGAFGVKGELRLTAYTDDPEALARYRDLKRADGSPALTLTGGRAQKGALIARAEEVATREGAEALRGLELYLPRAALPAPDEDEFYLADLIGLAVVTPAGEALGRIKSVQNFGAGDLLEIAPERGPSWWLPFTREAVPEVKLAEGLVVAVRPEETE